MYIKYSKMFPRVHVYNGRTIFTTLCCTSGTLHVHVVASIQTRSLPRYACMFSTIARMLYARTVCCVQSFVGALTSARHYMSYTMYYKPMGDSPHTSSKQRVGL